MTPAIAPTQSPSAPSAKRFSLAPQPLSRAAWLGLGVIVIAAAALRVWAACDEFWLDEIWSLVWFARVAKTPLEIFTLHHDNNHYLNTLWMYVVGPYQPNWILYRLPSLAAGVGTVVLSAVVARRWGTFAALAAALSTATSYVLTVYASEARGYALAGFFALVALLALDRYLATRSAWANLLFGAACMLGTLSHLTFVQFYLGAAAWSAVALWRSSNTWRDLLARLALCHAVPVAFLGFIYLACVRGMQIGGGDVYPLGDVVAKTLALTVGSFAQTQPAVMTSAVVAVVMALAASVWLGRDNCDLAVFLGVTVFLAPALLLAIARPVLVYERYFYLSILFALLLFSYLLSRIYLLADAGRIGALLLLLLFVLGNARLLYDFLKVGRGHYQEALAYMVEHSTQRELVIAGDDEFDNRLYLSFYASYLPNQQGAYFSVDEPWPVSPEWFVLHGRQQPFALPPTLQFSHGRGRYRLAEFFPYEGLSGYNFAVYHREPEQPAVTTE